MNATHTNEFWTAAGERWMNGESQRVIAESLGVTIAQLDRETVKLGYTRAAKLARKQNGTTTVTPQAWLILTNDQWVVIGQKYTEGVSLKELAAEIGCLPNWLRGEMKRRGFAAVKATTKPDTAAVDAQIAELQYQKEQLANNNKQLRDELSAGHVREQQAEQKLSALRAELKMAQQQAASAGTAGLNGHATAWRRLVKQSFGAMSRKYHPDMGGDVKSQTVVNACFEDLQKRFETK
jgi:hypothetical protein